MEFSKDNITKTWRSIKENFRERPLEAIVNAIGIVSTGILSYEVINPRIAAADEVFKKPQTQIVQ